MFINKILLMVYGKAYLTNPDGGILNKILASKRYRTVRGNNKYSTFAKHIPTKTHLANFCGLLKKIVLL